MTQHQVFEPEAIWLILADVDRVVTTAAFVKRALCPISSLVRRVSRVVIIIYEYSDDTSTFQSLSPLGMK